MFGINLTRIPLIDNHNLLQTFSVDKYRTEEDKTLTRKFSKLNMHSINKKSTRMSQRLFSSLGMETTVNQNY